MKILIRASNFRAPFGGGDQGAVAYGLQGTGGTARPVATEGAEARGGQGTTGSVQLQLVARVGQDTSGRAGARIRAIARQDTAGFAQALTQQALYAHDRHLVLAAHTDQTTSVEIPDYVAQLRLAGDWLKQANLTGGRIRNANCWDLIFEDLLGARLDHEIESYDGVNGVLFFNIRLPSWNPLQQYRFRVRYGADIA